MLEFTKMEVKGNDYIIINNLLKNKEQLKQNKIDLINMCDRNYVIGGDGLIIIDESKNNADVKITVYNNDGSLCKISGNAIICVSKYLYDNNIINKNNLNIETDYKNIKVLLKTKNNEIDNIIVNMGKPNINPKKIPVLTDKNIFINEEINLFNNKYNITCLSVGNPYAILFLKNIQNIKINELGPLFEFYYLFPERANIQFVEIINNTNIMVRGWERGNGETLSCASGESASVVAAVLNNYLKREEEINVYTKGGNSKIIYQNNEDIIINSNAKKVYEGKILIKT